MLNNGDKLQQQPALAKPQNVIAPGVIADVSILAPTNTIAATLTLRTGFASMIRNCPDY